MKGTMEKEEVVVRKCQMKIAILINTDKNTLSLD